MNARSSVKHNTTRTQESGKGNVNRVEKYFVIYFNIFFDEVHAYNACFVLDRLISIAVLDTYNFDM